MFEFLRPKKKTPESDGFTIFGGNEGETTLPSNPDELISQDNDYEPSHSPTQPEQSSLQTYRTQRSLDTGDLRVDVVATQKKQEHAAALAALTEAKARSESPSVIAKLQHQVDFLQMFLNEMRKDGLVPFPPTDDIETIEAEIKRLRFFTSTDENPSPDVARQEKTFEMLFAAKEKLLADASPAETEVASATEKDKATAEV